MTASNRLNSNTEQNLIDDTCGNITVEAGEFSINAKNFYRQTHTQHSCDVWALCQPRNPVWEIKFRIGDNFPFVLNFEL